MTDFVPHPLLRNSHLMTILPSLFPRSGGKNHLTGGQSHFLEVEDGSSVLVHVHLQDDHQECPTLLIVHGLEGSAESTHVLGLGRKAFEQGMNVVRMNLRNCGGTLHLSKTLYNASMSADVISVVRQVKELFGIGEVFVAGFSLGGNIVLKAAGELGDGAVDFLAGVCAISPSIDLNASVISLGKGLNRIYEMHFLRGLTDKIRRKSLLFPERFDVRKLKAVKTIKDFDNLFTAPDGGFGTADNYYARASSINFIKKIRVPTLIITAKDDPIVPFESFLSDKLKSPFVTLLATESGGHGGFLGNTPEGSGAGTTDGFWAEHRVVSFCLSNKKSG